MNPLETGMIGPVIGFNRVLREILRPLDLFYQPIQDCLLMCWNIISLVGTLAALSLITLGCVFWLLDLKKMEGNQLVMAGLLLFCMLQCLMTNLQWLFFLL